MTLFQDRENRIFKDAKWLQPLSNPPGSKPLCCENDLRGMAAYLSEIFRAGQARNLFVYGKLGTEKTFCVRHLLTAIRKHAEKTETSVLAVYVNAGRTRTPCAREP